MDNSITILPIDDRVKVAFGLNFTKIGHVYIAQFESLILNFGIFKYSELGQPPSGSNADFKGTSAKKYG